MALLQAGASPDTIDNAQHTALHIACTVGNSALVAMLLDAGATPNPLARPLDTQLTPLMIGSVLGAVDIVAALLNKGADVDAVVEGSDGATALHCAVRRNQPSVAWLLLEAGADHGTVRVFRQTCTLADAIGLGCGVHSSYRLAL